MKKNLIAGFLVAMLALAGVACSSDGGGGTDTEPATGTSEPATTTS